MASHLSLVFLLLVSQVAALGLTIEPTLAGDKRKYSGLQNLHNCISYPTVRDDIIMVRINSGDRIASQKLNLNIFDSENNKIRFKKDISQEINLIFTNLNSPSVVNTEVKQGSSKRSNIFNRLHHLVAQGSTSENDNTNIDKGVDAANANADSPATDPADQHIYNNKGKSLIYICFDNIYTDRSWSFHAQSRDIELFTEIKTFSSIKETNYNNYAHYFNKVSKKGGSNQEGSNQEGSNQEGSEDSSDNSNGPTGARVPQEFTQEDFEAQISTLEHELQEVSNALTASSNVLSQLLEHESHLRDTNEEIFAGYTKFSIMMLVSIPICALFQLLYSRYYLKKRKVL
ncbi:hypothetical protein CAAN1_06S02498 [[Candida] anglica]|uniref:GOLD domain-containing protein n=1 Tax=[Candida] anglica TaxID=148631 RepID=A0ABP0EP50_9ASCO